MAVVDEFFVEHIVRSILELVHEPYPHFAYYRVTAPALLEPRTLHPVFYGSYDWHSAVHSHWTLARVSRLLPESELARSARAALEKSFREDKISGELAFLDKPEHVAFERPYGLAWALCLGQELREWQDPDAGRWSSLLRPLEEVCAERFLSWLPTLPFPVRSGEHGQTAFALGLAWDWAEAARHSELAEVVESTARRFFLKDESAPLRWEPSAWDFLSPVLGEADLMRRVLPSDEFGAWLTRFLPTIPQDGQRDWLVPAKCPDPGDFKLSHLDGLAFSRAWMLDGIASALPANDRRRPALEACAVAHREVGLASLADQTFAGAHWVGSFATYDATRRGIP